MQDGEFEWDDAKAAANYAKHRVRFETASRVFKDPLFLERLDTREAYGEERVFAIGMVDGELLVVVYRERGERTRLISARRATKHEQDDYFRRTT
jgi:uncharacterized DUF497 family protein